MVEPDTSNAGVRSHTQISPPGAEAIIDINCRRTGSPSALNAPDRLTAVAESMRCCAIGGQQKEERARATDAVVRIGAVQAGLRHARVVQPVDPLCRPFAEFVEGPVLDGV